MAGKRPLKDWQRFKTITDGPKQVKHCFKSSCPIKHCNVSLGKLFSISMLYSLVDLNADFMSSRHIGVAIL